MQARGISAWDVSQMCLPQPEASGSQKIGKGLFLHGPDSRKSVEPQVINY